MARHASRGLRIVAGRHRGLRLETREGLAVRPTADRVREALFSSLAPLVPGAAVVDCFAGTGALGIEALSRGARRVVFVESDPATMRVLERNLARLPAGHAVEVVRADATRPRSWEARGLPANLILADPPYRRDLAGVLLEALAGVHALFPGGRLVIEHETGIEPEHAAWETVRRRRYGDTVISLYRRPADEKGNADANRNISGDV